ncbi:hypothetical protein LR48_Vigan02g043300 [Vigna angularis]|uniref:Uncharacterized protein n=1 Tax=Phaseolus angularis TaxID=3914 RepID=A0A0L9TUL7_PHAAN|nr:hypothetical protein LR48_Vigan02g043300 [Vigna angularis]
MGWCREHHSSSKAKGRDDTSRAKDRDGIKNSTWKSKLFRVWGLRLLLCLRRHFLHRLVFVDYGSDFVARRDEHWTLVGVNNCEVHGSNSRVYLQLKLPRWTHNSKGFLWFGSIISYLQHDDGSGEDGGDTWLTTTRVSMEKTKLMGGRIFLCEWKFLMVSAGIHGYLRVFFKRVSVGVASRVADDLFLSGRVAGRHYPCPTQPVVIPSRDGPKIETDSARWKIETCRHMLKVRTSRHKKGQVEGREGLGQADSGDRSL